MKTISRVNEFGMVAMPLEMCRILGIDSDVNTFAEDGRLVLSNGDDPGNEKTRTLDEFNRIVLPLNLRESLNINENDKITIELVKNKIVIEKYQ